MERGSHETSAEMVQMCVLPTLAEVHRILESVLDNRLRHVAAGDNQRAIASHGHDVRFPGDALRETGGQRLRRRENSARLPQCGATRYGGTVYLRRLLYHGCECRPLLSYGVEHLAALHERMPCQVFGV